MAQDPRELAEVVQTETLFAVVGKIVGTVAEERVLDESGKVDPCKLDAIAFDQFRHGYYAMGEKVGQAWNAGAALAKAVGPNRHFHTEGRDQDGRMARASS